MTHKQLHNLKIAVCSLTRDCGQRLEKNIPRFEQLASNFKETIFFVVENESKDNTRDILNTWQKKSQYTIHLPNIYDYQQTLEDVTIDFARKDDDLSPQQYRMRMARISLARDTYLHALKNSSFSPDFVIMCDMDVFHFSVSGILDSLLSSYTWDVVLAHGYMFEFMLPTWQKRYYDTYATELIGDTSAPSDIKSYLATPLSHFMQESSWLQVNSAFGGIGIYKYDMLEKTNLTYLDAITQDDRNFCEHLSFHKQLRFHGYDNIFINPNMQVAYNNRLRAVAHAIRKKFQKSK